MKKIIFALGFVFMCLLFCEKASASKAPSYTNMLDMSKLQVNAETGLFYSTQAIELKKDATYTIVATKNFFGEKIVEWNDLKGKFFVASYKTYSANNVALGFAFSISETGLHYTTLKIPEDCRMTISNFLSKGYTLENFPRDEVAMFEGDMSLFDGFRRYSDLTGYEKIGEEISIYTDIDNKISIDTLSQSIVASDNQDGLITDFTLVKDEYSGSNSVGNYSVVYEVKDSSNNVTTLNINVLVVDVTKPVISGPSEIIWELGQACPTLSQIKEYFTATDNVDGNLIDKVTITSSGLSEYSKNKEGKYMVVLGVTDKAGNTGSTNFFLVVKDTIAPTVVVKDVSYNLSESFSTLSNLAKSVYVSSYDATNNVKVSYECDEYLDEMGFAGKYEVTVTVKDVYNNATTKIAYLTIVDDISPEFYMKTDLLNTNTQRTYNVEDVKGLIEKKLKTDGIMYEEVRLISCDYFNNEKTAGEYSVKFLYKYKDSVNYMVGTIVVEEAPTVNYSYILVGIISLCVLIIVIYFYKRKRSMI